jgi:hypothetical protein
MKGILRDFAASPDDDGLDSLTAMVQALTPGDLCAVKASQAWYDAYEAQVIYPAREPALRSGPGKFRFVQPEKRLRPIRTRRPR